MTLSSINFKSSIVHLGGCGSPAKLSSFSASLVLFDELDKANPKSRVESSAVSLAQQRLKAWGKEKKMVMASTPTVDSGIESIAHWLKISDYRQFHVPCRKCGELNKISFSQNGSDFWVKYESEKDKDKKTNAVKAADSATLVCGVCGTEHSDSQKHKMVSSQLAKWIPSNPHADPKIRGYQLNSLYSFYVSTGDAVKQFLHEKESLGSLQGFLNGFMAVPWMENIAEVPDAISLQSR